MNILRQKICLSLGIFCLLFVLSNIAEAQVISIRYNYRIELLDATEPPKISALPQINYPEAARKNGVEGTLNLVMTLAKDGTVKDLIVGQGLPDGVTEAVTDSMKNLKFQPGKSGREPVDTKMLFDYIVTAVFDQYDKNISKPKILEKPVPNFPAVQKGEVQKDKIYLTILFKSDGTLEIENVSSTMPKEFDRAAMDAAEKIKFEPGMHKITKNPVSVMMTMEYEFKP